MTSRRPRDRVTPAIAFRLDLPFGRCVGLEIPETLHGSAIEALVGPERELVAALGPARRPAWVAGRAALRAAAADLGQALTGPVLATDRGAPALPAELAGSISHKRTLAVALAARREAPALRFELGVDIEEDTPPRVDISRRVLTQNEIAALGGLSETERQREILLRLSAKEAIYKALDPFVRRYVGFQEVAVEPNPRGEVTVSLAPTNAEGPFEVEAWWTTIRTKVGGFLLTAARIRARSSK